MKISLTPGRTQQQASGTNILLLCLLGGLALFFGGGAVFLPTRLVLVLFATLLSIPGMFVIILKPSIGVWLIGLTVPFERLSLPVSLGPIDISLKSVTIVTAVMFLCAFSITLVRQKLGKWLFAWILLPMAILITSFISSAVASRDPADSLESWTFRVFLVSLCFLIPLGLNSSQSAKRTTYFVLASAVLMSGYGLYQLGALKLSLPDLKLGVQFGENYGIAKITSFQANPNPFAGYLATVICLTLALILYRMKRGLGRRGPVLLACLALFVGTFLLTMSRSGMLGLFCGLLTLAAIYPSYFLDRRIFSGLFVFALLGVGLLFLTAPGQLILAQLFSRTELATSSSRWHLEFARGAIQMIRDRPVLGWGVNQYTPVFLSDYSAYAFLTSANTHSMYLTILVESGVVGLLPHVLLFFFIAGRGRRALRIAKPGSILHFLLAGLLAGFVSIWVGNIFYDYYFNEFVWFHFGFLLAVIKLVLTGQVLAETSIEDMCIGDQL